MARLSTRRRPGRGGQRPGVDLGRRPGAGGGSSRDFEQQPAAGGGGGSATTRSGAIHVPSLAPPKMMMRRRRRLDPPPPRGPDLRRRATRILGFLFFLSFLFFFVFTCRQCKHPYAKFGFSHAGVSPAYKNHDFLDPSGHTWPLVHMRKSFFSYMEKLFP